MIRFILSDLRRLWAGSLVVVLLVALASALGVSVVLQERALRLGSARAADKFDLVIGAGGSETQLVLSSVFLQPSPLPLMAGEVLGRLAADRRVDWAAPIGFGDSFSGYPIVGTTTVLVQNLSGGLTEGKVFAREGEAVIGSAVKLALGGEIKPMHGLPEEGGETHTELVYHIAGRLRPTGTAWDRAILVPIQAVWHIHGLEAEEGAGTEHEHETASGTGTAEHGHAHEDAGDHHEGHEHHGKLDPDAALNERWTADAPGLPAILVKPKTIADAYRLRQEYRSGNTVAVFPGEVLTNLYATLGDAKQILVAVAAGAQALVAASLVLVTVIHIGQRRRQIGALRAFGAPRGAIFGIVWLEFFFLVAVGIGLGFAFGYAAALTLSGMFSQTSGIAMPVGFAREDAGLAGVLLAFATILAALPAVLAYRQSPAQALRA
ncbi:putative ABC transport system permease protein [Rhizobium leguminosarum]|uniref:ABC transport system permease protein n=1 Tax=Rhizobium leguminosarum TaxID=384 RepID=A0AAE2MLC6_RHILE|nr:MULTISPECIES: FtsX-like permease family protein [Rhizobium]MBB4291616.1 putative ABC transport system permease protein [Rhizobium leguminosarum]MBB4298216.1 putative ABC transport system permease protein [Rhizobium leguminosarum]MBB4309354.1 putative ABC transport system permease protein [Rhizobium leguminosarum]MBB4418791.1 putative ABC transport system permease protein [Rhizobium leguminosarum]MBB4433878.1 putative ABC transport system permease protein [Rhizobium esperanzae]